MATINGHAPAPDNGAPGNALAEMIDLAEQARTGLTDAAGQLGQLIGALQKQRQQSKAVDAAMASLRRLQSLGG